MAFTPTAGITGTATLAGTELPIVAWDFIPAAEIVVFKNSLSGLHPAKLATFVDAKVSITVDLDLTNQPFAAPLSIVPGSIISNVKLYYDGPSGTHFHLLTSCIVSDTPITFSRAGKFMTKINLQGNGGTFTLVGGSSF